MTIKERIQSVLKERGISALQLENDLGFARGYISKLDKASPTADKLLSISDYLKICVDEILRDERPVFCSSASKKSSTPDPSNAFPISQFEIELVRAFRQSKHQAAICDLLCISPEKRGLKNA